MRHEFGTPYVTPDPNVDYTEALSKEIEQLIPHLFSLHNEDMEIQDKEAIIRLFEILKYGKEHSPFLLTITYLDTPKENPIPIITHIHIWEDPHYDQLDKTSTAFVGFPYFVHSLRDLNTSMHPLENQITAMLKQSLNIKAIPQTICIAGTVDSLLIVGNANKEYFGSKGTLLQTVSLPLTE